jgi:hypothetical protein
MTAFLALENELMTQLQQEMKMLIAWKSIYQGNQKTETGRALY